MKLNSFECNHCTKNIEIPENVPSFNCYFCKKDVVNLGFRKSLSELKGSMPLISSPGKNNQIGKRVVSVSQDIKARKKTSTAYDTSELSLARKNALDCTDSIHLVITFGMWTIFIICVFVDFLLQDIKTEQVEHIIQIEKVSTQLPHAPFVQKEYITRPIGNIEHRLRLVWKKVVKPVMIWHWKSIPNDRAAKVAYEKRRKVFLRKLNQSYKNS